MKDIAAAWSRTRARIALSLLLAAAGVVGFATLNEGYIDFGEGNYLYISWRLSEGAALYRDILSPQPPLHLHVGAALVWIGDRLGNATFTVRGVLVLVHLLTGWLIYLLARRWRFGRGSAALGVVIWLLCPIGYRWSISWQSENLENIFLLLGLILLAREGKLTLLLAGLCGAAALLCNMTAAPYVLFNGLFAVVAFRWRGLLFWLGLLGGWLIVALFFQMRTGAFFDNVILNQVGTYPADYPGGLLAYFRVKLLREGGNLIRVEGIWVALAIAGLLIAGVKKRRRWRDPAALHRGIYSLGGLLSITYVTKGGTADYIFCLGEPFVGIWAAHCLVLLAQEGRGADSPSSGLKGPILALLVFALGLWQVAPYFGRYLSQRGYEWPEDRMAFVVEQIEGHSKPGDLILAPPQFAYHTRRRLVEDFSSTYLWFTKWANERRRGAPGEGMAKMERIGAAIREGRVSLVALNGLSPELTERTARGEIPGPEEGLENRYIAQIDPIRTALFETCRRVGPPRSVPSNLVWGPSRVFEGLRYAQEELTFWVPRVPDDSAHE